MPPIKESWPVGHVDLPGTGNFCQIALLCAGVFKFDRRMGAAERGCRGDGQSSFISAKSIMISSVRKGGGGGGGVRSSSVGRARDSGQEVVSSIPALGVLYWLGRCRHNITG